MTTIIHVPDNQWRKEQRKQRLKNKKKDKKRSVKYNDRNQKDFEGNKNGGY